MKKFLLVFATILFAGIDAYSADLFDEKGKEIKQNIVASEEKNAPAEVTLDDRISAQKASVRAKMEAKRKELGVKKAENLNSIGISDTKPFAPKSKAQEVPAENTDIVATANDVTDIENLPKKTSAQDINNSEAEVGDLNKLEEQSNIALEEDISDTPKAVSEQVENTKNISDEVLEENKTTSEETKEKQEQKNDSAEEKQDNNPNNNLDDLDDLF